MGGIEPLEIESAVDDTVARVAAHARKRGLQVLAKGDATTVTCAAEPAAFKRVLFHLVENAIAFAPEGGQILVRAELMARQGTDRSLAIVVAADDATALLPQDAEYAIRGYEQLDPGTPGPPAGPHGRRLAAARRFAEALGGMLWLSMNGGKHIFTLVLPVCPNAPRIHARTDRP